MTKHFLTFLLIAALGSAAALAQDKTPPLASVKVQSLDALTSAARRLATELGAGNEWNPETELATALGSPKLVGVDRKKSWRLSLALSGPGGSPLIVLYVPVTDFEGFKNGLLDSSPLRGMGSKNELLKTGDYAAVVFRQGQAGESSAAQKQALGAGVPTPTAGAHLLEISLQPDEAARQQALGLLGIGRMGLIQALAGQKKTDGMPFNPAALTEIMGWYMDGIETLVRGLDRFEVQADLGERSIILGENITALKDSDLSRWFKPTETGLADLPTLLDPATSISFAAAIGPKPAFMPALKKIVRLSFQMQNQEIDEKMAGQIDQMLDTLAPMRFAGSVDWAKSLSMAGVYEFPGIGAKKAYDSFKKFFTDAMPAMTGTNKAYSSVVFKEAARKIGDVPVDRFSMTFNLDAPIMKMPGQREALEAMWGNGKMEIEYAIKGDRLYFANPEKMADVLNASPRSATKDEMTATPETAVVGRANILVLVKQMMAINPMIPAALKENAARLNTQGGDVRFRVNLDGRLSARADFPLTLLQAIRQFHEASR